MMKFSTRMCLLFLCLMGNIAMHAQYGDYIQDAVYSEGYVVGLQKPRLPEKAKIDADVIMDAFKSGVEASGYFSESSMRLFKSQIDVHIECLRNWSDKESYIADRHLNEFLKNELDTATYYKQIGNHIIVTEYLDYMGSRYGVAYSDLYYDQMKALLDSRVVEREKYLNGLGLAMEQVSTKSAWDFSKLDNIGIINICIIVVVLILLIVWMVYAQRGRKKRKQLVLQGDGRLSAGEPAIVVRRKTTSILKRQSLEDVVDDKNYMQIECAEFCDDSAVRRIYIKNTCVKDIYNMYAEDLRNPGNPKEDGCMVLGRWVYDDQSDEYYVSLEHIVRPGDDAVFQEYELNFGGKIKLKVAEMLRKLRRESDLQYDLTCWVHSHPGLGVFFSNSDSNVQMQLKHPTHPKFLTAIVIDILTPQQEMGIFTFRHDMSINSKGDLKKMYSLEELYKWAVESDRYSFKPEDHYNILGNAENRLASCYGVELSNGSIIDMGSLTMGMETGLVGRAYGFAYRNMGKTEYVVNAISKTDSMPDNDLIGGFLIGTHCSIPTIRKYIANYVGFKFVLFYSTSDGMLTAIPLNNDNLCVDEKYYGEEKLENLKIWTRRKR